MIQTETTKAKILLVEVPKTFSNFDLIDCHPKFNHKLLISNDKTDYDEWGENSNPKLVLNLPQGNWSILNTLDEVTEDEAALIAEIDPEIDFEDAHTGIRYPAYRDHIDTPTFYSSPRRSLQSLATSLGVQGKTIILYELKN